MEATLKKVKWISPQEDFDKLFNEKKYDKIVQLSEENEELLFDLYNKKETDCLRRSIKFGVFLVSYFKRLFQDKSESMAVFRVGKLMGYMELLDRLSFMEEQNQRVKAKAQYNGTKHLNEIIFVLETHGSATQTEISEILNLQPSTLSEALKKIRMTGLIQAAPYGKYKMYSLTEDGIRYGAMLRKKKSCEPEYVKAIDVLNRYIADVTTREKCLNLLKNSLKIENQRFIGKGDEVGILDLNKKQYEKAVVKTVLSSQTNSQQEHQDIIILHKYNKTVREDHLGDNSADRLEA